MDYVNLRTKMDSFVASNWLFAVSFVDLLGASLFMPVYGTHLRSLGLTHFDVGKINSAFHGAQLISGPIIGDWSDVYGRKPVLLITITICAVCYCALGFLSSFAVILAFRLILGVTKHTQTLCKALVADVMPSDKQTTSHGKLNAITSFGFMIGPVIGGHLIELNNGFLVVSSVVSCVFLLNSILVLICVPNIQTKSKPKRTSLISSVTTSFNQLFNLNWKNCWDILLLKLLFGLCISLYYSTYVPTMQEKFTLSQKHIGYTIAFHGLLATFFSISVGKYNELYDTPKITQLFYSFLILSLSFLITGFAVNFTTFIVGAVSLQASTAFIRTLTIQVLLERSSSEHRGSVVGTSMSINAVSKLVSPLISGLIADRFSLDYNSFLASIIAFVTCLLCLTMKWPQQAGKLK